MSSPTSTEARNRTYYQGDLSRALLDAAAEEIADRGPAAVSLREVARKVGVSHAAPAHHFGDKAGLFTALATEGFELLSDEVRRAAGGTSDGTSESTPESTPESTFGALVDAGVAYVRFATTYKGHFEVMWRTDLLRSGDRSYARAAATAFEALVEAVRDHQATGWAPDRDTIDLTISAWALAHGLASLHNAGALAWVTGDRLIDDVARSIAGMVTEAFNPGALDQEALDPADGDRRRPNAAGRPKVAGRPKAAGTPDAAVTPAAAVRPTDQAEGKARARPKAARPTGKGR